MPFITKAARAATLEATGVTEKIDALRREVTAAIQRAEDHMREDMRALRVEVADHRQAMSDLAERMRIDSAADRQAMFDLAEGFRRDAANDRGDAANDRQAMLAGAAEDRKAMLAGAAEDRKAMLDVTERIRRESETDRQAMIALVESYRQVAG